MNRGDTAYVCYRLKPQKQSVERSLLVHFTIADWSHHYSVTSLEISEDLIVGLDKAALPDDWLSDTEKGFLCKAINDFSSQA